MRYLLFTISLLIFMGCEKDDSLSAGELVTLRGVHDAKTRTELVDGTTIKWSENDFVNINGRSYLAILTHSDTYADFVDVVVPTDKKFHAFYPNTMFSEYNNGIFHFIFPDKQEYVNPASFATCTNPAVAYSGTENKYLSFQNLCGFLEFKIINTKDKALEVPPFKKIRFRPIDDQNELISGEATVTASAPLSFSFTKGKGKASIDVELPSSTTLTAENPFSVFFVVPPRKYIAGWKIQLLDDKNKILAERTASTQLNIVRSKRSIIKTPIELAAGIGSLPNELSNHRITLRGEAGSDDSTLELTNDPEDPGLAFKFGGVIGIGLTPSENGKDYFDTSDIAFNPSNEAIYNYMRIPAMDSYTPNVSNEHTADNIKKGLGDPCKLVGYTLKYIKDALISGTTPDNKRWRLPTNDENGKYYINPVFDKGSYNGIAGCFFTSNKLFYPYTGIRYPDNGILLHTSSLTSSWSSTGAGETTGSPKVKIGYAIYFDSSVKIDATVNIHYGNTVRCVAQT